MVLVGLSKPIDAQEPIAQAVKTFPGVEFEQTQKLIAQAAKTALSVEIDQRQEPIALASKTVSSVGFYRFLKIYFILIN
jgi:hypothetical protein